MSKWHRAYAKIFADLAKMAMSPNALAVTNAALLNCVKEHSSYPNWRQVEVDSGLEYEAFLAAFSEICAMGIVSEGVPSTIARFNDLWPLHTNRPSPKLWAEIRAEIFKRDDYTCQYCGEQGRKLQCDHVTPVARGGSSEEENLVTACERCNRSKGDRTLDEWLP